jgi:SAM-dependent methyltransferase
VIGVTVNGRQPADMHQAMRICVPLVEDRTEFLRQVAAEHRVVAHIGCTDSPYTELRLQNGDLLHARLSPIGELVGFDVDEAGLDRLRAAFPGQRMVHADIAVSVPDAHRGKYDLVIAGEVLEHVPNPGNFLRGCRELLTPGGELCLTVPNACSPKIAVRAALGYESVHPDHYAYYGPRTIRRTLAGADFELVSLATYLARPGPVGAVLNRILRVSAKVRGGPIGEGLIARARPRDVSTAGPPGRPIGTARGLRTT